MSYAKITALNSEQLKALNTSKPQLRALRKYYQVWRAEQTRLDSDINNPEHPEATEDWAWGLFVDWLESGNMTTDEMRELIEVPAPPHCPECRKLIDKLRHSQVSDVVYDFSLDEDGHANYSDQEVVSGDDSEWHCPHCDTQITTSEEQAVQFLKGDYHWEGY